MAPVNLIVNWCYNLLNVLLDIVTLGAAEGYLGERFADGFAASYGFGEALTSALGKFDGNGISYDNIIDDAVGSIPIVSHLYAAACIPGMLLWGLVDVHPSFENRAYSIINDLKSDLNDPSLSPAMKKQLQKEMNDAEISLDDDIDEELIDQDYEDFYEEEKEQRERDIKMMIGEESE